RAGPRASAAPQDQHRAHRTQCISGLVTGFEAEAARLAREPVTDLSDVGEPEAPLLTGRIHCIQPAWRGTRQACEQLGHVCFRAQRIAYIPARDATLAIRLQGQPEAQ